MRLYDAVHELISDGAIVSAYALDGYGIFASAAQMAFGNRCGIRFSNINEEEMFFPRIGGLLCEVAHEKSEDFTAKFEEGNLADAVLFVGSVTNDGMFTYKDASYAVSDAIADWMAPLEPVFATRATNDRTKIESPLYHESKVYICKNKIAKPNVFIPVFPGTNCEYDSAKVFEIAGAKTQTLVFKNRTESDITESVEAFCRAVADAQIIMFPGGRRAGRKREILCNRFSE